MKRLKSTSIFLAPFFLFCLISANVRAQSTLMNVPSTDVVPAKKIYLEMDFITNYASQRENSFQSYIPRGVVGVARNVEVGANVSYTHVSGASEPIEIQPNIKWQFYKNEGKGTAGAVGCILYAPVTHRAGTDTFGMCYTVFSKRLIGFKGPRFTGGTYALVDRRDGEGTRLGAIAGYEQPLTKRFGFTVDWFSGNNRFGYVSPGFSFATSTNSFVHRLHDCQPRARQQCALCVLWRAVLTASCNANC